MGLVFLARRYSAEKHPGGEGQASFRKRRKTRSPGSRTSELAKTICLLVAGPQYLPSAHTTFLLRTTQLLTLNPAPSLRPERPHRAAEMCHGSLGFCEFTSLRGLWFGYSSGGTATKWTALRSGLRCGRQMESLNQTCATARDWKV